MAANKAQMDCLIQAIESAFNPNDFISEIEARPAIWNHTDSMYNNQACKRAAWDSLIRKYYPDFDERPSMEQTLICKSSSLILEAKLIRNIIFYSSYSLQKKVEEFPR